MRWWWQSKQELDSDNIWKTNQQNLAPHYICWQTHKLATPSTSFVYQGKDGAKVKQKGQKEDALRLTSAMDLNTSPLLFNKLAQNHTAACGTIQMNEEGFPKTTTNNLPNKPERGAVRETSSLWVDTKIVNDCRSINKPLHSGGWMEQMNSGLLWTLLMQGL